jgi:hypothetical protein
VQILRPFAGSIQEYDEEIADPSRYRPDHCSQCQAAHGLTAHGFYRRALVDADLTIDSCAPLPVSSLSAYGFFVTAVRVPYLRFSVTAIALFLMPCGLATLWSRPQRWPDY